MSQPQQFLLHCVNCIFTTTFTVITTNGTAFHSIHIFFFFLFSFFYFLNWVRLWGCGNVKIQERLFFFLLFILFSLLNTRKHTQKDTSSLPAPPPPPTTHTHIHTHLCMCTLSHPLSLSHSISLSLSISLIFTIPYHISVCKREILTFYHSRGHCYLPQGEWIRCNLWPWNGSHEKPQYDLDPSQSITGKPRKLYSSNVCK